MAYKMFQSMLNGRALLCAYNAQFDASFLATRMPGFNTAGYDWLDLLTVYKDRAAYPHKLSDAIEHYRLGKKVQNTHRAIDDVMALYEVMKAMMRERSDIAQYINIFGYNPKYGVEGSKLPGIEYKPQAFTKTIKEPSEVLPLTEPDYVEPTMGYGQPAQVAQPQIIVNNTATATVEGGFSAAPKSRMVALILCILFGIFGIHRFYVGKVGTGIIWMFSGGVGLIGWVIDIILIITGGFTDKWGRELK